VRIAVVIPLYRLAQFLNDAVTSALEQTLEGTGVVIVNDGCPDPASHQLGTAFAAAYPDRIAYVRQPNAGPSAARNHGVRHALGRWPGLEAFFFLDADNLLEPHTLDTMYTRLVASKRLGWVYAALERFGAQVGSWYPDSPANLYRMLFENQSDAGSLVRREVFDKGIFFDEHQGGYEDWEFFVRVLRNGYEGESAGYCGFRYRVRELSRYRNSKAAHDANVARLQAPHRDLLEPRRLTEIENEFCPRFLWIEPQDERFTLFTDPEHVRDLAPGEMHHGHWPPVLLVGSPAAWQLLMGSKTLRNSLLLTQALLPRWPVTFRFEDGGKNFDIVEGPDRGPPHIFCLYSWEFQHERDSAAAPDLIKATATRFFRKRSQQLSISLSTRAVELPAPLTVDVVQRALLQAYRRNVFDPAPKAAPNEERQGPVRYFAWNRHCVQLDTTHPVIAADELRIGFVVPWLKLGGVDQCVIQLARAMRNLVPKAKFHLVTTREGVERGVDGGQEFDEITFLGSLEWEKKTRLCDVVFRSMDLLVNAHSEAAYQSLKWRLERVKEDRTGVHVSYLHVMDEARGRLVGYPAMAAELAHALDGFAVISENLRNFLINEGVDGTRIKLTCNAPVVRPPSMAAATELAVAKARRLAAGERPLRLLFAGRADYQKGIVRLKTMTELLMARGAPFELRFVGASHLKAELVEWPVGGPIITHPATHDETTLASYYAAGDVCVLLSRWEGVPLSLLDAMAHGCVVVATDVGGVSELVEDRKNGFVLPNGRDEAVAAQAADMIEEILQDETGSAAMRRAAVATAWSYSWDETARVFLSFLPDAVKARHGLCELLRA
jgi:glycosyltransferase involved in cell wall biosynthesis